MDLRPTGHSLELATRRGRGRPLAPASHPAPARLAESFGGLVLLRRGRRGGPGADALRDNPHLAAASRPAGLVRVAADVRGHLCFGRPGLAGTLRARQRISRRADTVPAALS